VHQAINSIPQNVTKIIVKPIYFLINFKTYY
jgi:hypothetical protein